jgi:hypothetical protein
LAKLRVKAVPATDAWGICPHCSERFFVPSPDKKRILEAVVQPRPFRSPVTFKPEPAPASRLELWPETLPRRKGLGAALIVLAVSGLLYGLVRLYGEAAGSTAGQRPDPPAQVAASSYGDEELRVDLRYLRRRLSNYVRHARRIDFSGPESRVFKFLQAELFPQGCSEIVSLDLATENAADGFALKSTCLDPERRGTELQFRFDGGWVAALHEPSQARRDVPLLESALRAWNEGQRQTSPKRDAAGAPDGQNPGG